MTKEETIRKIALRVHELGGRALLVGGCVRDGVLRQPCYDIDCEVHGIEPDALKAILETFGEIDETGMQYGILTLKEEGLDIALPRRERRTGPGHRDFEVAVDPWLNEKEAASRRDFTINAIMRDALTGEYVDPFGGMEDLQSGILRAVPGGRFEEDPLRVMRGAQFAARFLLEPDRETMERMRRMPTGNLAASRVYAEMKKALLMAQRPGRFFEVLKQAHALEPWFGELKALCGVQQNPLHHPEGDAWAHTLLVLDAAAGLKEKSSDPLHFMLSALTHDLGKAVSSAQDEDGNWHARGHAETGVKLTEQMLGRLGAPKAAIRYAKDMCRLHMRLHICYYTGAPEKETNLLFDQTAEPQDLALLCVCDTLGTGKPKENADREEAFLMERLQAYRQRIKKGMPDARMLMRFGAAAGPDMKEKIALARRLALGGMDSMAAAEAAAGQDAV